MMLMTWVEITEAMTVAVTAVGVTFAAPLTEASMSAVAIDP